MRNCSFCEKVKRYLISNATHHNDVIAGVSTPRRRLIDPSASDSKGMAMARHDSLLRGFTERVRAGRLQGGGDAKSPRAARGAAKGLRTLAVAVTLAVAASLVPGVVTPAAAVGNIVTFDANGGTGSMTPQTYPVADRLTSNTFTRTDYVFVGWNTTAGEIGRAHV